jgi:hypothetical protein
MAFVGTSFVKRGKVGNAKAKDTVRYIQHRPDKDKERVMRPLFTSDGPMTRLETYQFTLLLDSRVVEFEDVVY